MADEVSSPDLPASAPVADVRAMASAAGRSHGSIMVPDGLSRPRGILTPEAAQNFRARDPNGPQIHFADPARNQIEISATPRTVQDRQSFAQQALTAGRDTDDPKRASVGRVAGAVLKSIFGDEASHDVGIAARRVEPETDKPGMETRVDVRGKKVTAGIELKF